MNSVGPEAFQESIAAPRRRAGSPGVDDRLTAGNEHSIGPVQPCAAGRWSTAETDLAVMLADGGEVSQTWPYRGS
ncbi:glutathione S-transferase family protein [Streptomyces europaeiscabiei]|uniref:hypothetical protein n=1 Tax=Streptomyces europaeiscabiei TaxID=146819 RepID=UPI0038F6C284